MTILRASRGISRVTRLLARLGGPAAIHTCRYPFETMTNGPGWRLIPRVGDFMSFRPRPRLCACVSVVRAGELWSAGWTDGCTAAPTLRHDDRWPDLVSGPMCRCFRLFSCEPFFAHVSSGVDGERHCTGKRNGGGLTLARDGVCYRMHTRVFVPCNDRWAQHVAGPTRRRWASCGSCGSTSAGEERVVGHCCAVSCQG